MKVSSSFQFCESLTIMRCLPNIKTSQFLFFRSERINVSCLPVIICFYGCLVQLVIALTFIKKNRLHNLNKIQETTATLILFITFMCILYLNKLALCVLEQLWQQHLLLLNITAFLYDFVIQLDFTNIENRCDVFILFSLNEFSLRTFTVHLAKL